MSTEPSTAEFYDAVPDQLAVLLDALDGVPITDHERRTLYWLSGWEKHTVENLAALITRARQAGPPGLSGRQRHDGPRPVRRPKRYQLRTPASDLITLRI
ncbi:MAG: hypothetical protein ACRDTE_15935, partial [Pseudonocardiaceae bacterium]